MPTLESAKEAPSTRRSFCSAQVGPALGGKSFETRGRFIIENEPSTEEERFGDLDRRTSTIKSSSPVTPGEFAQFVWRDRMRRRKRLQLLALSRHALMDVANWSHLGSRCPPQRFPKIAPTMVKGGKTTLEVPLKNRPPAIVVNGGGEGGVARRTITTLLGGAFRKKITLDPICKLSLIISICNDFM